jgi:hypothetical protein
MDQEREAQEAHMVHCPNCGQIKVLAKGNPGLKGRCKTCLQADLSPVSINFVTQQFEIYK